MRSVFSKLQALLIIGSLVFATGLMALPAVSYASAKDDVCQGVGLATGNGGCNPPAGTKDVGGTVKLVINILSSIVGVVAVIMVIIGGFKYVTSTGDSAKVNSAKDTILFAIVGLIIVALAQMIVRFVLHKV